MIETVRGKGLLNAVVIKPTNGKEAMDVCLKMAENGVLAKPTHGHIIRFAPPLVIDEEQMLDACERISKSISFIWVESLICINNRTYSGVHRKAIHFEMNPESFYFTCYLAD